jgi:hypothetical protein
MKNGQSIETDNCITTIIYILSYTVTMFKEHSSQVSPYLYTGKLITYNRPVRERKSKWFISVENYPYEYNPPCLAGGSIITSDNVAKLFRETFPYVHVHEHCNCI